METIYSVMLMLAENTKKIAYWNNPWLVGGVWFLHMGPVLWIRFQTHLGAKLAINCKGLWNDLLLVWINGLWGLINAKWNNPQFVPGPFGSAFEPKHDLPWSWSTIWLEEQPTRCAQLVHVQDCTNSLFSRCLQDVLQSFEFIFLVVPC